MVNTLTLEMLDDGCVVITLESGPNVLRAAAQSIETLNASPLFAQFRSLTSDPQATLSRMQSMAAEMNLARATLIDGPLPAIRDPQVDASPKALDHVAL